MAEIRDIKLGAKDFTVLRKNTWFEQFKTDFTKWKVSEGCDIEVTHNKLIIKKCKANMPMIMTTDAVEPVVFTERFYNFKVKLSGVTRLVDDGTITPYEHGTWGGPNYFGRGISFMPCNTGGTPYSQMWPWDLGIPSGYLKNPNYGWANYGFSIDGFQDVYSQNKPFAKNNYPVYVMGIIFYSGKYKEGEIVDLTSKPITISLFSRGTMLSSDTFWESFISNNKQVYHMDKSVANLFGLHDMLKKNEGITESYSLTTKGIDDFIGDIKLDEVTDLEKYYDTIPYREISADLQYILRDRKYYSIDKQTKEYVLCNVDITWASNPKDYKDSEDIVTKGPVFVFNKGIDTEYKVYYSDDINFYTIFEAFDTNKPYPERPLDIRVRQVETLKEFDISKLTKINNNDFTVILNYNQTFENNISKKAIIYNRNINWIETQRLKERPEKVLLFNSFRPYIEDAQQIALTKEDKEKEYNRMMQERTIIENDIVYDDTNQYESKNYIFPATLMDDVDFSEQVITILHNIDNTSLISQQDANNYVPQTCTELTLSANDTVNGSNTVTSINAKALTNGIDSVTNEPIENVTVVINDVSDKFEPNLTDKPVQQEISYTYLDKTAKTTIEKAAFSPLTNDFWEQVRRFLKTHKMFTSYETTNILADANIKGEVTYNICVDSNFSTLIDAFSGSGIEKVNFVFDEYSHISSCQNMFRNAHSMTEITTNKGFSTHECSGLFEFTSNLKTYPANLLDWNSRGNPRDTPKGSNHIPFAFEACSLEIVPQRVEDRESDKNTIICHPFMAQAFNQAKKLRVFGPVLDLSYVKPTPQNINLAFNGLESLTDMHIKKINHGDWDFTGLPLLNKESITYLFNNAYDLANSESFLQPSPSNTFKSDYWRKDENTSHLCTIYYDTFYGISEQKISEDLNKVYDFLLYTYESVNSMEITLNEISPNDTLYFGDGTIKNSTKIKKATLTKLTDSTRNKKGFFLVSSEISYNNKEECVVVINKPGLPDIPSVTSAKLTVPSSWSTRFTKEEWDRLVSDIGYKGWSVILK